MKKLSRNGPCHCGSGKKYKKCHMQADLQEANDAKLAAENAKAAQSLEKSKATQTASHASAKDPLVILQDEFFDAFFDAPATKKWLLVEEALQASPEIFDAESVFEVCDALYLAAVQSEEYDRFYKLTEQLETQAPEGYKAKRTYIYEWKIEIAATRQDQDRLNKLFYAFSEIAAEDIDGYYRALEFIHFYGTPEVVLDCMRIAYRSICDGHKILPWVKDEFLQSLIDIELLIAANQEPNILDNLLALQERVKEAYDIELNADKLAKDLTYRSGKLSPDWSLEAFQIDLNYDEKTDELDAGRENLLNLSKAFAHFVHNTHNVPLVRTHMGSQHIINYLIMSQTNSVEKKRKTPKRKKGGKRRPSSSSKQKPSAILILDPDKFNSYLGQLGGFLFYPYHQATAFCLLIPLWYQYLIQLNLLTASDTAKVLDNLKPVVGHLKGLLKNSGQDGNLTELMSNWPNHYDELL